MATRRIGLRILAVLFAVQALNGLGQSVPELLGAADDPMSLTLLQLGSGITALAAAIGSWRGARWAPWASIVWGVVNGALLAALQPILDLPLEARPSLLVAAAVVFICGVAFAWYLRRATATPPPGQRPASPMRG
jgi:hypothetical protein